MKKYLPNYLPREALGDFTPCRTTSYFDWADIPLSTEIQGPFRIVILDVYCVCNFQTVLVRGNNVNTETVLTFPDRVVASISWRKPRGIVGYK